jgi:hypothetical protein
MSDDERIAHLIGESSGTLDDADLVALDDLRDLLADPAVWATPSAGLEGRVVAAIASEAGTAPGVPGAAPVVDLDVARRRRGARSTRGRWVVGAGAAVAAAVLVAVLAGGVFSSGAPATRRYVALAAVNASGASGAATLTRTDAGWRIELDATGLPRLDDDTYYEAWLKSDEGVLVPVGTFNEGGHLTLWAGVSPAEYTTFTVTTEAADGNQASSGHQVLAGRVTDTRG